MVLVLFLAYYVVQFLAFSALFNLSYFLVLLLAYFVEHYLAYSALQLLAFPACPFKKPLQTVASQSSVPKQHISYCLTKYGLLSKDCWGGKRWLEPN